MEKEREIEYKFWKNDTEFFWVWLYPSVAEQFRQQGFVVQGYGPEGLKNKS